MIFPYSYHSKETVEEINRLVGKPFGWMQRFKLNGIGSQRLLVLQADTEVKKLLDEQNTPPFTNIELRPKGIIFWFRVKLDNYVLVLPFGKIQIHATTEELNIVSDPWNLRLIAANRSKLDQKFIQKLMGIKTGIKE